MSVLVAQADARCLPIRNESVHLVVTSPPYNAGIRYDAHDDWLPFEDWWQGLIEPTLRECYRVLGHGGRLCLNLPNVIRSDTKPMRVSSGASRQTRRGIGERVRKTPSGNTWRVSAGDWPIMLAPLIWPLLEEIGFLPREQLTWLKATHEQDITTNSTAWGTYRSATNPVLRATVEPVFIASKGSHSREPGQSDLTGDEFKAWTRNAWAIPSPRIREQGGHPAPFPSELPRRLIKLYSYVGDVVLDPFTGSGTTVKAARSEGRHGIGLDISERYCRLATGRSSQMTLLEAAG